MPRMLALIGVLIVPSQTCQVSGSSQLKKIEIGTLMLISSSTSRLMLIPSVIWPRLKSMIEDAEHPDRQAVGIDAVVAAAGQIGERSAG